jgi:ribonuclease Z
MRQHPLDRVTVHASPNTLAAIENHLFAEVLFPKRPSFDCKPLGDTVKLPCGASLSNFPLEHQGGSVGFRLDWPDRSMAYVTDTTAALDADYVEKIAGVDLLVHECYFPDSMADWAKTTGHSYTTPVAEVARKAGVKRLLLVHLNPLSTEEDPVGLDVARAIFPNTDLGVDLMEVEF